MFGLYAENYCLFHDNSGLWSTYVVIYKCHMLQYMENNAKNIRLMMWQDECLRKLIIWCGYPPPPPPPKKKKKKGSVIQSLYQDHNSTFLNTRTPPTTHPRKICINSPVTSMYSWKLKNERGVYIILPFQYRGPWY